MDFWYYFIGFLGFNIYYWIKFIFYIDDYYKNKIRFIKIRKENFDYYPSNIM